MLISPIPAIAGDGNAIVDTRLVMMPYATSKFQGGSKSALRWSTEMKQAKEEPEEEAQLMVQYGIVSETKRVFVCQRRKYDKWANVLRYARAGADVESGGTPS
jgi:hypothetical protein